ncbi:MAG: DUF1684 domain-containing protein [Cyclobacteriaceae bacterium]|nr:DUF1684 domain-containing protein [Cyclobacteriaceae bacterium]
MKHLLTVLLCIPFVLQAQPDSLTLVKEILTFQDEQNKEFRDKATSPLKPSALKKFKHHDFFPINLKYVVQAQLTLTPDSPFISMKATGKIVQAYRTFAIAQFQIDGQSYSLTLYQSKDLKNDPEYEDYLFLPFTDLTTGDETYGGGRYLGLRIPKEGNMLIINFNLAYNPYCAYSDLYSCPLVPKVNDLPVAIRAGVKLAQKE